MRGKYGEDSGRRRRERGGIVSREAEVGEKEHGGYFC